MKKSIIKDIFYGRRGHIETMGVPKEHFERGDEICGIYEELKEKLSPELFILHQKFVDALEEECLKEVDFYFAEGFKLGLLIGIESMED